MMKLKKVLSLVLVVAMIASMLIVGAAAAETVETTNYPEATEVMIGIGVIEGDENGYRYQDGVTREEAAKIIAYILLGADTADALKTSVAPFADVAADRWSAGYIAYLKNQGIISGVTDTLFDPTAPVTGVAFAKMMLTAVGYGQNDEFEGAAWDINTITLANQLGLYEDSKAADVAAAATREECMLYGFNALVNIPTVGYNKTFEAYYVGTSPLNSVADPVKNYNDADKAYVHTLAWKNYELEQDVVGTDDFGRPAVSWIADGTTVADTVANQEPFAIITGSLYSGNLYPTLGKNIIKAMEDTLVAGETDGDLYGEITVWTEGVDAPFVYTTAMKAGEYTNYNSGTGAYNEIYVNYEDGEYDIDIVVYYEHIAKVTKLSASANTMTIKDEADDAVIVIDGEDFNITGYAKNEYVLYTRSHADIDDDYAIDSFAVVTPVVGTYSGASYAGSSYVVDGVPYSYSAFVADKFGETGYAYEVYYNSLGNIMKADLYDDAEATNTYKYFYIVAAQAQEDTGTLVNASKVAVAYNVVYADGGEAIVDAAIKYDAKYEKTGDAYDGGCYYVMVNGEKKYITDEDGTKGELLDTFVAPGWYSFTANDNGEVSIKDLSKNSYATTCTTVKVDEGKASLNCDYTANSSTVLTIVDEDGNKVSYTGIANFPENKDCSGKNALILHDKDSVVAKNIVVYDDIDPIKGTTEYAYVIMSTASDDENVTYMAYVDGAMQFITLPIDNVTVPWKGIIADDKLVAAPGVTYTVFEIYTEDGETYLTWAVSVVNNGGFFVDYTVNAAYATLWFEDAIIDEVDDAFFTTTETADGQKVTDALDEAKNAVAAAKSEYPSGTKDIEDNLALIEGYEADIAALEEQIDALNPDDTNYATDKAALESDIDDLETKIETAETAIKSKNDSLKSGTYGDKHDYLAELAALEAAQAAYDEAVADSVGGRVVLSNLYYYDNDTVIYDCVSGGIVTELSSGDVFMAVIDADYYCEYIWIVG